MKAGSNPLQYGAPVTASLNQAAPIQNQWYPLILPAEEGVRLIVCGVNIEDANETVEVRMIWDGVTMPLLGIALAHSTNYRLYFDNDAINREIDVRLVNAAAGDYYGPAFLLEAKSLSLEVRKTTANGAGNLTAAALYQVLE